MTGGGKVPAQHDLNAAFLLHSRPYRDSSLIVDFLTRDCGRISAVAKGVRRAKSRSRGLLQPFVPLLISWSGKHELKTLRSVEAGGEPFSMKGNYLFSALYMNEILMRLLHGHEVENGLYRHYRESLTDLQGGGDIEAALRKFEIILLNDLGYALDFQHEGENGAPIDPAANYVYMPETGFCPVDPHLGLTLDHPDYYSGEDLQRMAGFDFRETRTKKAAKRLMRQVLGSYLGDKPLKSRQLFAGH